MAGRLTFGAAYEVVRYTLNYRRTPARRFGYEITLEPSSEIGEPDVLQVMITSYTPTMIKCETRPDINKEMIKLYEAVIKAFGRCPWIIRVRDPFLEEHNARFMRWYNSECDPDLYPQPVTIPVSG